MAAKINSLIPLSWFELIRDRIGQILSEELQQQFVLSNEGFALPEVWIERFKPFDKEEYPAVNVTLLSASYSNKTMVDVAGDYTFAIDIYTSSPFTEDGRGDTQATLQQQRIIALCRAILENPVYKTLDFPPPSVSLLGISSFDIATPQNVQDATSQTQARIVLSVRATEWVSIQEVQPIAGQCTTVTLELTDKGYRWCYEIVQRRSYITQNGSRFTTQIGDVLIPQQ